MSIHEPEFGLPSDWEPVPDETLNHARQRTLQALEPAVAVERLKAYLNADSDYSGALFNELDPDAPVNEVTAGDLLAVASLNVEVTATQIRQLHTPGPWRTETRRALADVPANVPLALVGRHLDEPAAATSSALLTRMEVLQGTFRRTGRPKAGGADPNRWVFGAKLAARKRPELFPVRDSVVCEYLSPTGRMDGTGLGTFRTDIQVFAHLMNDPAITALLADLRAAVPTANNLPPLRLLDVALWMAG